MFDNGGSLFATVPGAAWWSGLAGIVLTQHGHGMALVAAVRRQGRRHGVWNLDAIPMTASRRAVMATVKAIGVAGRCGALTTVTLRALDDRQMA